MKIASLEEAGSSDAARRHVSAPLTGYFQALELLLTPTWSRSDRHCGHVIAEADWRWDIRTSAFVWLS